MTDLQKFPLPSSEREDREEALGLVWRKRETGVRDVAALKQAMAQAVNPAVFDRLVESRLVHVAEGTLELTAEGETLAADVTRRHRLAERLLTDVLSLERAKIDPTACVLEHILSPEVADSICTLLGHPAECPHGLSIPPGACCRRREGRLSPLVGPLSALKSGDRGRVAYLQIKDHPELHRLMALGVIPGAPIHVHQTSPAFVVEIGESQLALEAVLAARIFVRHTREKREIPPAL
jgi:DtxR family Mn-dependent transcriptional regulator